MQPSTYSARSFELMRSQTFSLEGMLEDAVPEKQEVAKCVLEQGPLEEDAVLSRSRFDDNELVGHVDLHLYDNGWASAFACACALACVRADLHCCFHSFRIYACTTLLHSCMHSIITHMFYV